MEAAASYLLILEKYINSKEKTLKDFTTNNVKRTGLKYP